MSHKDEYFAKMVSQLKRWDARLAMLNEKIGNADAEYELQAKAMRATREIAYRKLQDVGAAAESAWRGKKPGVDSVFDSMTTALDAASNQKRKPT